MACNNNNKQFRKCLYFAAILMAGSSPFMKPPPQFRADRPFVYHIYDRKLKAPIFSGHVTKLQ